MEISSVAPGSLDVLSVRVLGTSYYSVIRPSAVPYSLLALLEVFFQASLNVGSFVAVLGGVQYAFVFAVASEKKINHPSAGSTHSPMQPWSIVCKADTDTDACRRCAVFPLSVPTPRSARTPDPDHAWTNVVFYGSSLRYIPTVLRCRESVLTRYMGITADADSIPGSGARFEEGCGTGAAWPALPCAASIPSAQGRRRSSCSDAPPPVSVQTFTSRRLSS